MPCYAGTSVECRADDVEMLSETRAFSDDAVDIIDAKPKETIDYSIYEKRINDLKAVD